MTLTKNQNTQLIEKFIGFVRQYINKHPNGFKEHDLIKILSEKNYYQDIDKSHSSSLELFQKHFLLFHVLYLIADQMVSEKSGTLSITALLIKKLPYIEGNTALDKPDNLREYYLDLSQFSKTNEEEVNELLNSFWTNYLCNDKRKEALQTLGLSDPVDNKTIKMAYRRLANTLHPDKHSADKRGNTEKIQEINRAYSVLLTK